MKTSWTNQEVLEEIQERFGLTTSWCEDCKTRRVWKTEEVQGHGGTAHIHYTIDFLNGAISQVACYSHE